jgi:hypothetical protein
LFVRFLIKIVPVYLFKGEWKPIFENDEENGEKKEITNNLDKRKRPNLFQLATRTKTYLIESKNLPDELPEHLIDKFGELILFSESVLKLGYAFDQGMISIKYRQESNS